jgi:hypothetical protein
LAVAAAGGDPLAPFVVGVKGAGDDHNSEDDEEKLHKSWGEGVRGQGSENSVLGTIV